MAQLVRTTRLPQNTVDRDLKRIYNSLGCMARKPYKPENLLKTRIVPVRVTGDFHRWLEDTSSRLEISASVLMREGAKVYARQLEQKDGPRKEKK